MDVKGGTCTFTGTSGVHGAAAVCVSVRERESEGRGKSDGCQLASGRENKLGL